MKYEGIQKKLDGTFVINFNGMPFHVTPDYPPIELYGEDMTYAAIVAYSKTHPEEVAKYEESIIEKTEAMILSDKIAKLEKRVQELLPRIQAELSEQDVTDSREELKAIMVELENIKSK